MMKNKRKKTWLVIITVVVLLAVVLRLPPVWSRVVYHSSVAYRTVKYWLKPPSEAVFVPSPYGDASVVSSSPVAIPVDATTPQPTTEPTAIPSDAPAPQPAIELTAIPSQPAPEASFTPTPTFFPTPTPLPPAVLLTGISVERQLMNNCGPATLSLYL